MSQRSLELKKRLAAGATALGAWLSITDPVVAEIMAGAGFDYVLIDTEHAPWSLELLQTAMLAFRGMPTVPIVRVPWNDQVHVKQALDLGADGVLAPMVRSAAEARALVAAAKYPPDGIRGFGPRRASDYGRDIDAYVASANAETIVIPQIEDLGAAEGDRGDSRGARRRRALHRAERSVRQRRRAAPARPSRGARRDRQDPARRIGARRRGLHRHHPAARATAATGSPAAPAWRC